MGMFGKRFDPSQGGISAKDRAAIFLQAMAGDLGGAMQTKRGFQNAPHAAAAMQQLQDLLAPQTRAYTGPIGPTMDGAEPQASAIPEGERTTTRRDLRDPAVQRAMLNAQRFGVDPSIAMKLFDANGPDIRTNGQFNFDARDPKNADRFFPSLDKGQAPIMHGRTIAGVQNLPGAVQSTADMAGAVSGAQEQQKAAYDLVDVPLPNGGSVKMPRLMAGQILSGRVGSGGAPAGLGQSQTPADAAAAKVRAEAQAGAQVDLPRNVDTANATLDLIQSLRDHPGRKLGTGATGILPGIPGTDQKDFVKLLDQAKGKAFLEAFATLKGGGQITEVEGRKATDAIARLDRQQSEAGFLKALDDLEAIVRTGASRAQHNAGAPASPAAPSRSAVEAEMRRRGLLK